MKLFKLSFLPESNDLAPKPKPNDKTIAINKTGFFFTILLNFRGCFDFMF